MKQTTPSSRAQAEAVAQRLSECITRAVSDGVVPQTSTEVVRNGVELRCVDPVLDEAGALWTFIQYPCQRQAALSNPDEQLWDGWDRLYGLDDGLARKDALVAWRLHALARICELFWDVREVQAGLSRIRSDWLKAAANQCLLSTQRVSMMTVSDPHRLQLDTEEVRLVVKLENLRWLEDYIRARCDAAPRVPVVLVEKGESARVAFLQRQLRWARVLAARSEGASRARAGLAIRTLLQTANLRRLCDVFATSTRADVPSSSSKISSEAQPKALYFDLLVELPGDVDFNYAHEDIELVRLGDPPPSRCSRTTWQAQANARRLQLLQVVTRCEEQLAKNATARIPIRSVDTKGENESKPLGEPYQVDKTKLRLVAELSAAQAFEKFY